MKEILLFSGGLDSYIAWHYLDKPQCLYVPLRHRYQHKEVEAILRLGMVDKNLMVTTAVHNGVPLLNLGKFEETDGNIPMRNSFLVHIAAYYGDLIWLIIQKGEMEIPDRTVQFTIDIAKLLTRLNGREIEVNTPFLRMTKTDMVKWYIKNTKDTYCEKLKMTYSCYSGLTHMKHCGTCTACFRRWVAFSLNGIEESYVREPYTTDLARRYLERAKEGYYKEDRANEIIEALKRKNVV